MLKYDSRRKTDKGEMMPKNGISALAEMAGQEGARDFLNTYTARFGKPEDDMDGFANALAGLIASAVQDVMDAKNAAELSM